MAKSKIYPFNFNPGTKRDNTLFEGNYYSDAKWCRWYRGKAKKIGGYRDAYDQFSGLVRGEPYIFTQNNLNYIYAGNSNTIEMLQTDLSTSSGVIYDKTPVGFTVDANNEWKTTAIYNSAGSGMVVVAMATQTLSDISDSTNRKLYYGDITDTAALTQLGTIEVSGGIVALQPYLFAYGNDGYIAWSDKNAIANIGGGAGGDAGEARICANKVVKGMPLRGGANNSPSGLFWSLDTIQRISYVGGTSIFRNDTIATGTSLLSTNAVIDYDGVLVWPAVDKFMSYNGVVQEIPNNTHLDWFYDNYNKNSPQKIFAIKKPRFGEIWFCFPYGDATECTHALIYNYREKYFYDTELPENGRCNGISPTAQYENPLMFGVEPSNVGKYIMWQHEYGVNKVVATVPSAIESYFETPNICFIDEGPLDSGWTGVDKWVRLIRLEPDFVLAGALDVTVTGRQYAMSDDLPSETYTYTGVNSQKINSRKQYRQFRIRFRSNELDGNYYQGKILMELAEGDVRASSFGNIRASNIPDENGNTSFTFGATWGSITGTLSDQADLQNILNAKANIESPTFTGIVTLPSGQIVNGVVLTNSGSASDFLRADGTYGAASGSAAWGAITGTLSSQTDLQTALNAKANVSGQVFTGAISATNLSGTNTGDQTNITGNAGTVTTINGKVIQGTNVTISGTGTNADPYVINASDPAVFAIVEKNLGSVPRLSGKFTITGLSGLTIGKPVNIFQAVGPYTGKGTLADESEMDGIVAKAVVTAADTITAYWNAMTRVKGNVKFNYLIGE